MGRTLLEVKHLKKYFNVPAGVLHAVDDVSFTIEEGKTLGIVGESGCGKSTTGRAILRLIEPTSGEVIFNGIDVAKLNKKEMREMRKEMQLIFQDPFSSLNPRKTVAETIEEPLILSKMIPDKEKRFIRVLELMDRVGPVSYTHLNRILVRFLHSGKNNIGLNSEWQRQWQRPHFKLRSAQII